MNYVKSCYIMNNVYRKSISTFNYNVYCQKFLKPCNVSVINKLLFHRQVNNKVETKFKIKDNIPASYSIIYRAPLETYLKITYYSAFTAFVATFPFIGLAACVGDVSDYSINVQGIQVMTNASDYFGLIGGLLFMVLQVSFIVFKYPLRIYKNPNNKYIMVYQDLLPWKHRNEEFIAGELKRSTSKFWKDSLYVLRNRKAILLESHFTKPIDLHNMLQNSEES